MLKKPDRKCMFPSSFIGRKSAIFRSDRRGWGGVGWEEYTETTNFHLAGFTCSLNGALGCIAKGELFIAPSA